MVNWLSFHFLFSALHIIFFQLSSYIFPSSCWIWLLPKEKKELLDSFLINFSTQHFLILILHLLHQKFISLKAFHACLRFPFPSDYSLLSFLFSDLIFFAWWTFLFIFCWLLLLEKYPAREDCQQSYDIVFDSLM